MDIRSFKYFDSVVRNKQFTLAAEELHISQPSLSNAIKLLEQHVGCKLLDRSTRNLSLTESGQVFYKSVLEILERYEKVNKEMKDVKNVGAGILKIGMIESFRYWLPQIIKQFKVKYPMISIKIREMSPMEIEVALKNYDIHLGITSSIGNNHSFNYLPIFEERLVLITPTNHRFHNRKTVSIPELKDEVFIHSLSGFEVRQSLVDACLVAGFNPEVDYETESLETARSLVEIGLGISVIPENFLKLNPSKKICLIHLKSDIPNRVIYIAYDTQRYLPPAVHDFVILARNVSKENLKWEE